METVQSKAEILARLEAERAGWEALLAEVGEDRMTEPGVTGSWTFKDTVAHLNGWRERTVDRLEAVARGEDPPPPAWPAGFDEDSDAGVDQINDWFYERGKDRSVPDVLAETGEQFERLRAAVQALPERDLLEPGRFSWLLGASLSAVLAGSFGHFHEEHEPAIRAWLDGREARA